MMLSCSPSLVTITCYFGYLSAEMYKPNFCVECGERVLRARWYPWTSRKFCKYCVPRSIKKRFAGTILIGVVLISLGFMTGRSMRQSPPPLIVQNTQGKTVPADWSPKAKASAIPPVVEAVAPKADIAAAAQPEKVTLSTPMKGDIVTLCGAKTKKGTMCTRRVHGGGRSRKVI